MKILKLFKMLGFIILTTQTLFAEVNLITPEKQEAISTEKGALLRGHGKCCGKRTDKCHLGTSGFSVVDSNLWYPITTFSYPVITPLSLNGNRTSSQGEVIATSTGLTLNEPGNYSVSFQAILVNNQISSGSLIPVFLISNGVFDPLAPMGLGSIATLSQGSPGSVQGTGILENVTAGTTLSLVATNGSAPQEDVTVISWYITAFKIPCQSSKSHRHHH